jgi:hypothetical protein
MEYGLSFFSSYYSNKFYLNNYLDVLFESEEEKTIVLKTIANLLNDEREKNEIIILSGPKCSGKETFLNLVSSLFKEEETFELPLIILNKNGDKWIDTLSYGDDKKLAIINNIKTNYKSYFHNSELLNNIMNRDEVTIKRFCMSPSTHKLKYSIILKTENFSEETSIKHLNQNLRDNIKIIKFNNIFKDIDDKDTNDKNIIDETLKDNIKTWIEPFRDILQEFL